MTFLKLGIFPIYEKKNFFLIENFVSWPWEFSYVTSSNVGKLNIIKLQFPRAKYAPLKLSSLGYKSQRIGRFYPNITNENFENFCIICPFEHRRNLFSKNIIENTQRKADICQWDFRKKYFSSKETKWKKKGQNFRVTRRVPHAPQSATQAPQNSAKTSSKAN